MLNKMNFENYNDYLLSLNISQISREFGFKKVGINSLYLITHLTRTFIEKLATETKETTEISNRTECNLIDLLFTLLDKQISQEEIMKYIKESKIKYEFSKGVFIRKIYHTEEKERNIHIRKINSSQISENPTISKELLNAIPPQLRFFPRDFGGDNVPNEQLTVLKPNLKKPNVNNTNQDDKKLKKDSIVIEKKGNEEINNLATNYFDMSKKHSKKKISVDIMKIINDITVDETEIFLGKKLKREDKNELALLGATNNVSAIKQ